MKGAPALVAEFLGTFALCFFGAGAVCMNQWTGGALGSLGIAITHGAVLGVMISALGHVSGAHFNPAVTAGLLTANKIDGQTALAYVLAQLIGAVAAAALLAFLIPAEVWQPVHLGAPAINIHVISVGKAVLLEGLLTFFLVLTVFGTAVDPKGSWKAIAGFGIGTVLIFEILVGGPLTGAAMNPARAFGPALVAHALNQQHFIYWLGPILGGVAAGALYANVLSSSKSR